MGRTKTKSKEMTATLVVRERELARHTGVSISAVEGPQYHA